MTITGTLALFAALWARVLKRNKFRVKQMRYKTKQQELKNYKYNKRILLFFFLVGAERGEVEVRHAPGARRRRGSFPWPLGGSILMRLFCSYTNPTDKISVEKRAAMRT